MTRRWYAAAALVPLLTLTAAVLPASVAYAASGTPGGSGPGGGSSPGGGSTGVHIVPDRNGGTSGVTYSPPRRSTPSTGSATGRSGTGDATTGRSSTGRYPADTPGTGDSGTEPQAPDQSATSADPVGMGRSNTGAQPRTGRIQNGRAQNSATPNSQAQNDPAPAPNPPPRTELTITIAHSKVSGHDGTFTLTCHNTGGSHPDPVNGCAKLDQMSASGIDPFAPVSTDATCTQQYGGPATATVVGSWAGRQINATFSRSDGCQIKRWNDLMPVLPPESTS